MLRRKKKNMRPKPFNGQKIKRKLFFRREVGGPLLERAAFNYSCHCYPTKTPDSCQVDESRNSMKTTRARKRFQTRV